jgi:hypothetical protein
MVTFSPAVAWEEGGWYVEFEKAESYRASFVINYHYEHA